MTIADIFTYLHVFGSRESGCWGILSKLAVVILDWLDRRWIIEAGMRRVEGESVVVGGGVRHGTPWDYTVWGSTVVEG